MSLLYDLQKNLVAGLKLENRVIDSIGGTKLSPVESLAIYRNSILGAKQKTLKEIYPVCHKLVGEEFFIAMSNRYISQTISQSPNLGDYGGDFFQFIAAFEPAKSVPYLADVARLELAVHGLYSAAESLPFYFQKLVRCYLEGHNVRFQLPQGSALLSSPYPIHQIWEVGQDDYQGDFKIDFLENLTFNLFVWSNSSGLRMDVVDLTEWQILNWMQVGVCLSDICDSMSKLFPEKRIEEILPRMVSLGWIAGFSIEV